MINFCITNSNDIIKKEFTHELSLGKDNVLYYDDMVEIRDLPGHLIAFCGILWQGEIEDFVDSDRQNGQFYAVVLHKESSTIKVISDFIEDFPVYYYIKDGKFAITNSISAYSRSLEPDTAWLRQARDGAYADRLIQPCAGIMTDRYLTENITPIKDVRRLGAGRVMEIKLASVQVNFYNWYNAQEEYVNPMFHEPRHNLASAKTTVDRVLRENANTLKKKYGSSLVLFGSTGIDSLSVMNYLDDVPKYGYYGEHYKNESPELLKNLYKETGGTLHYFDANEYRRAYTETIKGWRTPTFNMDLAPEMHIRNKYGLHDSVIVKGTFGDEIFWHDPRSAMSVAVHSWNLYDRQSILDSLKDHYSYQPFHMTQYNIDNIIASKNLEFSIMNHHYNRQKSYLKDDRVLLNQMIISPFIDLRLRELLPQCDTETKLASILDARIQRDIVSDELIKYMNQYKSGGEESFPSVGYKEQQKNQLNEFMKSRSQTSSYRC